MAIEGRLRAEAAAHRRMAWQGWHIAYWSRVERLPPLSRILGDQKPGKSKAVSQQTPAQIEQVMGRWRFATAAMFTDRKETS